MGFKSIMKGIGKVALKAAPFAAMAIPGLGIPLSMAIQGGIGAAQGAASGKGLKGALLGGGLGAAGGAVGAGALKGIGPSSSVLGKLGAGAAGKTVGTGLTGKIGGVLGQMGANALGRPSLIDPKAASGGGKSWKDVANTAIDQVGRMGNQRSAGPQYGNDLPSQGGFGGNMNSGIGPSAQFGQSSNQAVSRNQNSVMPRGGFGYNENPMNQTDQSNPNLAQSIFQGKQEAIRNQPFRKGYDVKTLVGEPDPVTNEYKTRTTRMPRIFSSNDSPSRRNKKQEAAY